MANTTGCWMLDWKHFKDHLERGNFNFFGKNLGSIFTHRISRSPFKVENSRLPPIGTSENEVMSLPLLKYFPETKFSIGHPLKRCLKS